MLALEVAFLSGRYAATSYNDRSRAEWPPHPARLYSALVAAHHAAEAPAQAAGERAALQWLAELPPPHIAAPEASHRDVCTVFVPVNDRSAVKVLDAEFAQVEEAQAELEQARSSTLGARAVSKAEAALARAEQRYMDAAKRAVAAPTDVSASAAADGHRVLPEHRNRQPRTFPSVFVPEDPAVGLARVVFYWPDHACPNEFEAAFAALLSRVVRLGHSASVVHVRLVSGPPGATPGIVHHTPSERGERLRTWQPGQLEALEQAFALHQELEPRVMPARFQCYEVGGYAVTEDPAHSLFESGDWLVLRALELGSEPERSSAPRAKLPLVAAAPVARAFRRALMSPFGEAPIPAVISGHEPNGQPTRAPHLAVVPLPEVMHHHAGGGIRGIALVFPRAATPAERSAVFRALNALESRARLLPENEDVPTDEPPAIPLKLGTAGVLWLERLTLGASTLETLRPESWCDPQSAFVTATPIALDRNPGPLWRGTPAALERAHREAAQIVATACERIGLPTPAAVHIQTDPWFRAGQRVQNFPKFDPGGQPRLLVHARIAFERPVRGPLLLGAGRYAGLGLCLPAAAERPRLEQEVSHVG